jgi:L-ribulokinase
MTIVAGIDFGTASVRVSIVDSERGRLSSGIAEYTVQRKRDDPDRATQRHAEHLAALEKAFNVALTSGTVDGADVRALAIATTGSTVIPVDERLQPLDDYYLWCDHRAWKEAAEITAKAREASLEALDWCGGTYSSEWGFAKLLHWLRHQPQQRERFYTAIEHCDLIAGTLCGIQEPEQLPRSICAMGHKWMWNLELGGLPSEAFLSSVDALLTGVRARLGGRYGTSNMIAGGLCEEWAKRLGLKAGIPIPIGALDAHWDAIGAGCRMGDVVNVIGTSTCIMALADTPRLIPGVSGVVQGSIHPGKVGIEAGLAAVGDLFDAIARRASTSVAALAAEIQNFRAGQTGLTRIAWDNGDRCVLTDARLRGITLGWRLDHTAADELFAAIEGTALHTRIILERLEEYGVPIGRVIHAGGIPQRNSMLNRIYASVIGKPILVPAADTTSLGSAIFAFLSAGAFQSVEEAQDALSPGYDVIEPVSADRDVYQDLYGRFRELYFRLGSGEDHLFA